MPGYRLRRVLGRGGMAVVYEAVDERSQETVALKRIQKEAAQDPAFVARLDHEVRLQSSIRHPNVVALHDWAGGEEPFIAMELAPGGTLRSHLDRVGKLPPELALFAALQVCRGLAAAHERGIVHRDVKPQNVLVAANGVLKVSDFGLAISGARGDSWAGAAVGTPAYMSPEQAEGRPVDARSDVFSLGTLLHEMLTGVNPFLAGDPETTLKRVVELPLPPLLDVDPTIPFLCERLVARMTVKQPEKRYGSATKATAALEEACRALGVQEPFEALARYLASPQTELEERNRRFSREHLEEARRLLESGTAPPETVLWEAFVAASLDRENPEAAALVLTMAQKTGYRIESGPARARTRDLETRLREDPGDVELALLVARSAKLDRDFLRLMRCYLRLSVRPIDDPILRDEVAALLSGPPAPRATPIAATPEVADEVPLDTGPQSRGISPVLQFLAAAALLGLLAAVLLSLARP